MNEKTYLVTVHYETISSRMDGISRKDLARLLASMEKRKVCVVCSEKCGCAIDFSKVLHLKYQKEEDENEVSQP